MATGTGIAATGNEFIDKTIADGIFSPDVWSKKVMAATESNLVLANLFNRQFESDATVGKAVKIASIGNLSARAKTENAAILYETITETVTTLTLNIWDYAAIGIEDIVEVQSNVDAAASSTRRRSATRWPRTWTPSWRPPPAGFTQTVGTLGTPFTDDNVRRANQYLDDADVPEEGRFLVMTPAEKNDKLALDRWSNQLYRGGAGGRAGYPGAHRVRGLRTRPLRDHQPGQALCGPGQQHRRAPGRLRDGDAEGAEDAFVLRHRLLHLEGRQRSRFSGTANCGTPSACGSRELRNRWLPQTPTSARPTSRPLRTRTPRTC